MGARPEFDPTHRTGAVDTSEATVPLAQLHAAQAEIARLRRQNHEHAERRDREMAHLQRRVARHEHLVAEARRQMLHAAVDWTDDPPSERPGGWWRYASVANVAEVIALVDEIERLRTIVDTLQLACEGIAERGDEESRHIAVGALVVAGVFEP